MAEQQIIVKKKITKGHAHHGGSWKVAYADFMTAMMAFFLVMWLTNLSQDTKDLISGYFNDPLGYAATEQKSRALITMPGNPQPKPGVQKGAGAGAGGRSGADRKEIDQLNAVQRTLQRIISEDPRFKALLNGVKISQTDEGLLIEFMEAKGAVFFESGSSVIRPQAMELVNKIAPVLQAAGHSIEVQGHTDAQPIGLRPNGNFELGADRALSLQTALESSGVQDRLFTSLDSFAANRPLNSANPLAAENRRVTILLPRKYRPGSVEAEPADALRQAVAGANQPEAVVVKPDAPDLMGGDRGQW